MSSSKARSGFTVAGFCLMGRGNRLASTPLSYGRLPMPLTLRTTLCEIRDDLHVLRRMVAARGHIETIQGIDALIGVAEAEAIKVIRRIDRSA